MNPKKTKTEQILKKKEQILSRMDNLIRKDERKKTFEWVFEEIEKDWAFFLYKKKGLADVAIPNLEKTKERLRKELDKK